MNADERGDMGFMESMIATMAVIAVLTAFIGLAAGTAVTASDPTGDLDADMMTGTITREGFVPGFSEYIDRFVASRGLSGAAVVVTVPGGFCGPVEPYTVGDLTGDVWSRSIASVVGTEDGRSVLAVFEVMLCGRTTAGSWRWWTPWCSSW